MDKILHKDENIKEIYERKLDEIKSIAENSLQKDIKKLYEEKLFADLSISTSTEKEFCHKAIIRCRAGNFYKLLKPKSDSNKLQDIVEFSLKTQGLDQALKQLYSEGNTATGENFLIGTALLASSPSPSDRDVMRFGPSSPLTPVSSTLRDGLAPLSPPPPSSPPQNAGTIFWVGMETSSPPTDLRRAALQTSVPGTGSKGTGVGNENRPSTRLSAADLSVVKREGKLRRGKSAASSSAGSGEDSFWVSLDPLNHTAKDQDTNQCRPSSLTIDTVVKGIDEMNERLLSCHNPSSIAGSNPEPSQNKKHELATNRAPLSNIEPFDHGTKEGKSHCLAEDLLQLLSSGDSQDSDVTLFAEDVPIKAHKCILAIRSPYFAMTLENDPGTKNIELPGASYDSAIIAIRFIYGAVFDFKPHSKMAEVAFLAHKYGLPDLQQVAQLTITRDLHFFHKPCQGCLVNLVKILPELLLYNLTHLLESTLGWILRYLDKFFTNSIFVNYINATSPQSLLALRNYMASKTNEENVIPMMSACRKVCTKTPRTKRNAATLDFVNGMEFFCKNYVRNHFPDIVQSNYLEKLLQKPKASESAMITSKFIMDLTDNIDLNADSALNILNRSEGLYKMCLEHVTTCSNPDIKPYQNLARNRPRKMSLCENRESSPNLVFLSKLIQITNSYLTNGQYDGAVERPKIKQSRHTYNTTIHRKIGNIYWPKSVSPGDHYKNTNTKTITSSATRTNFTQDECAKRYVSSEIRIKTLNQSSTNNPRSRDKVEYPIKRLSSQSVQTSRIQTPFSNYP